MIFELLLSIFASVFVGLHIYSIQYIRHNMNGNNIMSYKIFIIAILSFAFWCLSRMLLYRANREISIVTLHLILSCSVFTTLFLTVIIDKSKVKIGRVLFGTLLTILGIYIVKLAY